MLEFIRTHRRLMQLLLLLLILPSFALFGLQSYTRFHDETNIVAQVNGQAITQEDWDRAYIEQIDRLKQMLGSQFDQKLFDTPEAKQNVLENLITKRVMMVEAEHNRMTVSNQALQQVILAIPGLTTSEGRFDVERYKALLAAQGLTPLIYENRLKQELLLQQINAAIQATAFAPKSVIDRLSDLNEQEREVQELLFKASDYLSQVKLTDQMLKSFYDSNIKQFEIPEQVKVEYVVLDKAALATQISVSDNDIKSYYEQNMQRYRIEEQRRASHILIEVKKNSSEDAQLAAKAKAEALLLEARKNPGSFAKLAKENSQDPGSAERGGDLDFFSRGMMVKPFEDAVFNLKQGDISEMIKSDYGYHIIQLTGIKPATVKPIDEVKSEISTEIKKQQAGKKYTELVEIFTNSVYEQADSLKSIADKLKLKLEIATGIMRAPNPAFPLNAPFNNPKFLQALFSDDLIKNKHNTEAVEVAPNTLIAGRILEYKPVTTRRFEDVLPIVQQQLKSLEAMNLAKKIGQEKLIEIKTQSQAIGFSQPKTISRVKNQAIHAAAVNDIMKMDVSKLPAYVGVELPEQGYAIYRINKLMQPTETNAIRRQTERQKIANNLAQQEMHAYIQTLKKKAKVKILQPH